MLKRVFSALSKAFFLLLGENFFVTRAMFFCYWVARIFVTRDAIFCYWESIFFVTRRATFLLLGGYRLCSSLGTCKRYTQNTELQRAGAPQKGGLLIQKVGLPGVSQDGWLHRWLGEVFRPELWYYIRPRRGAICYIHPLPARAPTEVPYPF